MVDVDSFVKMALFDKARAYKRGFFPFIVDAIRAQQQHNDITSIVEIGIGSGRNHVSWHDSSSEDTAVGGIDIFDYRLPKCANMSNFDKWKRNQIYALQDFENRPRIHTCYGMSGYEDSSIIALLEKMNRTKIDFVRDDGLTGPWEAVRGSFPPWKKYISEHGFFISETPDGNGTPTWWAESTETHLEHFAELKTHGLIVFDMSSFRDNDDPDFSSSYLGFWAPNMSLYTDLIGKYRQYIAN